MKNCNFNTMKRKSGGHFIPKRPSNYAVVFELRWAF